MSGPGHDASCVLRDGRIIEYWDGGDPDGRAVIFHPGTPVTRLLGHWGHEAAVTAHTRLVAVNRPGYGGSTTPSTAPSLSGTGRDTATLAAALGLERYAVIGWSGGGPHAVASAVADPHRVRAVAVVGGIGPWRLLDEPTADDREDRGYLALLDAGDTAAAWAGMYQLAEQTIGRRVRLDDEARVDAFFDDPAGVVTRDVDYRAIWAANLAQVIENHDGGVLDNLAWGGTWDVDPADVAAPTVLWYGDQDRRVPVAHGRWYNEHIDGSELVMLPGEGHFDVIDGHWPQILDRLLHIWE